METGGMKTKIDAAKNLSIIRMPNGNSKWIIKPTH